MYLGKFWSYRTCRFLYNDFLYQLITYFIIQYTNQWRTILIRTYDHRIGTTPPVSSTYCARWYRYIYYGLITLLVYYIQTNYFDILGTVTQCFVFCIDKPFLNSIERDVSNRTITPSVLNTGAMVQWLVTLTSDPMVIRF